MTKTADLLKDILTELQRLTPPPPTDVPINIGQTQVTAATPVKPSDPDVIASAGQPGYDVISVFNEKKKLSNKIWVMNDGPGILFAMASSNGERWTGESEILVKETRAFTQVYELRVRSPDAATKYRATEYEPAHI